MAKARPTFFRAPKKGSEQSPASMTKALQMQLLQAMGAQLAGGHVWSKASREAMKVFSKMTTLPERQAAKEEETFGDVSTQQLMDLLKENSESSG